MKPESKRADAAIHVLGQLSASTKQKGGSEQREPEAQRGSRPPEGANERHALNWMVETADV
jgi:hypothetical protein